MKRSWNAVLLSLSLTFVPTIAWSEASENASEAEKPSVTVIEEKLEELLPDLTQEEYAYLATLMEADQHYQAGKKEEAIALYQKAKPDFSSQTSNSTRKPYTDLADLPPDGKVYWGYGEAEFNPKLQSKTLAPLELLVEKHPSFIPGHLRYAEALVYFDQTEAAIEHLESAVSRYPRELTLVEAILPLYEENEQWLNASLTARQFALLNTEHSQAEYYSTLADQHLETYERKLRISLRENAFASIVTGALGFALTGSLAGPLSAIETTALLLQGESVVGNRISNRLEDNLPLLEDEEVQAYVTNIGQTVTQYAGRDSFDYEFHIIMDENLNAFALPGGKVFINAGAILKTKSEAELAGLIAHEISHAVLSHGFQLVTEGNVLANVSQFIPYGGTAANLIVLNYSRVMERQADALGTRLLASSKYAADGVYNLMVTLEEENQARSRPPVWLSTHPNTEERVKNLEAEILENGYDRYRYEGISRHLQMQEKTARLLAEYQAQEGDEDSED
ncbi:MAG: M48 family metallopeptidase [Halothece sp. Uz-M2-17]|nr:M48 family metallopeptidase [Halothece sp. Uz-M2-17]